MDIEFSHPRVRDLAWVMDSPSILSNRPELVSDTHCQTILKSNYPWLCEQDRNPELFDRWLDKLKSRRLGYYFEYLVEYWLTQCVADKNFASHIRVFDQSRTIGEFDFLFKTHDSNCSYHWETAVKYYLHFESSEEPLRWYGPNARDRLDIKLNRTLNHQLKLGSTPQGRAILHEKGFAEPVAQTFFKGYLFYPLTSNWQHPRDLPAYVAPGHLRGWWVRVNEFDIADNHGDVWFVLPRLEWLAPKIVRSEQDSYLMDRGQLRRFLDKHFSDRQQPLLIAQMQQYLETEWREITRGFVVGANWPNA